MRDDDMKELGYLRRATEENTRRINEFYSLLDSHMEREENKVKAIDRKLTLLTVCTLLVVISQGSGLDAMTLLKLLL